jgi:hypothetical protein
MSQPSYNPNVNPNANQMSNNDIFSQPARRNFHMRSPALTGTVQANVSSDINTVKKCPLTYHQECWRPPAAPSPQPSSFSEPMGACRHPQLSSPAAYLPYSNTSDSSRFNPGPLIPTTTTLYTQYREEFKQALSASGSAKSNSWLPELDFKYPLEFYQLPDPSRPLLPPYSSSSFGQLQLPTSAAANTYLEEVIWRPSTGTYGVPTNEGQKSVYVKKICLALVNLSNLYDTVKDVYPYAVKFASTGLWSDPRDIEATAHIIVGHAIRIHTLGVTGLAFRRCQEFESLNAEDMDFTLPQRIHFLARLFWHSKVAADDVMLGRDVIKYVALPLTSLRRLPLFEEEWSRMWDVDRRVQTQILPYPQGLRHPTREELDRISAHVRTLPSLVKNYMATGSRFGTFGQRQCVPGGSAAPAKRTAEQDGGYAVEPAAKRYHDGAYVSSERGVVSGQLPGNEGQYRSSHTPDAGSQTWTPGSDGGET